MADTIPYGAWPSPISADDVVAETLDFGDVAVDDDTAYWLERRPSEGGRGVVVRGGDGDGPVEVTPASVDVRTTVHEYGGGDFAVHEGTVVYSRFEDQRLYRTDAEAAVEVDGDGADGTDADGARKEGPAGDIPDQPITPAPPEDSAFRYADPSFTPDGRHLYCVRERHHGDDVDDQAVNELVFVPVAGDSEPTVVASGHDFYSYPRISPDGDRLAWTTWDHPRMPWDGTELHVATIDSDGSLSDRRTIMGGPEESVFQPEWGPDGGLFAVSDRTGWWNLYEVLPAGSEPARIESGGEPTPLYEDRAEYGSPQWVFGTATYQFLPDGRVLAIRNADGRHELVAIDPDSGDRETVGLPYEVYPFPRLAVDGGTVLTVGAGPATPPGVVRWEFDDDTVGSEPADPDLVVLRRAFSLDVDPKFVSEPSHVTYPTGENAGEDGDEPREDGEVAHALYYPPENPDVEGPDHERPPLVVKVHGGPTSQTLPVANLEIQYFTTRGIGVVDVNYRGSTGYGRAYRDRLKGEWGVVDTRDCVEAARYLAGRGDVDSDRLAIRGGSAGGYATLCALAFYDTFDAGASYYGVADLRQLAEHTHKFESRYLDSLVGPLPEASAVYEERSPAAHGDRIATPLLVLQGGEDRVVPPDQADGMVESLVAAGTPYAYVEYPEERHGFRKAGARRHALETELSFYASVFGFEPAEDLQTLDLDRGEFHKRTFDTGEGGETES